MSADERARRAENRDIVQLEATVAELQRNFSDQIEAVSDTLVDHSCTLDKLTDKMTDGNSHSRGANVPISPFYGNRDEDFTQYIKQFELVCHANNYDNDKRAQILASYLRDKAFYVYDSLTADEKNDYDALKTALTAKFQTSDYRRYAHQKFQSRKQLATESVPDYGCAVHKLGMAALSTVDTDQRDALIREKFISGLLPHLHELIVYSNPKNFHEAMTLAERLEGLQSNRPDHSARHVMLLESIHDRISNLENNNQKRCDDKPTPEIAYVIERPVQRQEFSQQPVYPRTNLNNFRQDFRPTGMVCFRCNRTGHIARNCPQNQNMNSIICRNCNTTGHYARNCQRRGISNRGRGMAPRTNIWTNDRNAERRPYAPNTQTFNRSMAIAVPETEHSNIDEIQNWRPLVGSLKTTRTSETDWKIIGKPSKGESLQNPAQVTTKPTLLRRRELPIYGVIWPMFLALLLRTVMAESGQGYKMSAPMMCQANDAKTLWKLPQSFNCPEGNHSSDEDVWNQNFRLYKQNYIQYKTDAWKCVKVRQEVETFTYFFGDENLKQEKKYQDPVSSEECTAMKRFNRCGNDPMRYEGGIYQTDNKLNWYYPGGGINCCHWKKFTVTNCFMYQSHVYKRHDSTEMESAAGDVSGCSYEKGQCLLNDVSFLLWDVSNKSLCNLLPWKTMPGKSYGTSWLSDDSNLALTFTQSLETKDCAGNPLLLSDQGIAVKPLLNSPKRRVKKQLTIEELNSFRKVVGTGGVVSSAQLAASMQALETKWRRNMNFAFSHALNSVCNFMRSVVELLRTQVLADPTNAIRSLTNQSDIFVRSGGNIIEIYPCQQLPKDAYTLLPMNDSCTVQIPIKFWINNKTAVGYLDPMTNIVHRYARPIDCNLVKEIPVLIGGKTYIYKAANGDLKPAHNIPTLKILQWNIEPVVDMKATIFHEIVIYSWSELQTHISLNDIMGGLSRQRTILKKLGISDDELDTDKAAGKAISKIMDVGYFGFLRGLTLNFFQIWTFCVCLYVTICIILIHCCPIAAIPFPLNLPKAFRKIKNRWNDSRRSTDDTEQIPLPSAPQLFQRFPRENIELATLNRYVTPRDIHTFPNLSLKALPPPPKPFSVSQDYLAETTRPLHDTYPSLQFADSRPESDLQPFRVNMVHGPDEDENNGPSQSETIVDALLDDRITVPMLIDSGSSRTIISEEVARRLRKKPVPCEWRGWALSGLVDTVGKIDLTIQIADQKVHGTVVVMKEGEDELILGTDFMRKIGTLSLNFRDRTIKINQTTIFMERTDEEEREIERQKRAEAQRAKSSWTWTKNRRYSYILKDKDTGFIVVPQWQHPNHRITFSTTFVKLEGHEFQYRKANFHELPFSVRDTIENNCKLGLAVKINNRHRNRTENWDLDPVLNNDAGTLDICDGKLKYTPPNVSSGPQQETHRQPKPTSRINAVVGNNETAIDVCLEGMKVRTLLDTGSSLTIVPLNIAEMLKNPIVRGSVEAVSMTGHQLPVIGEVKTIIRIGRIDIEGKVVVTQESPYALILGTDLLKHFGTIKMDFKRNMVTIGSELVPMTLNHTRAAVMLCQPVKIPPQSTISVMGFCYGLKPENIQNSSPCYFSPSEKLLTKYDVISNQSVVVPHEKVIPVLLTNHDNAPKFMPEKASLGSLDVLADDELTSINAQDSTEDMIVSLGPKRNPKEMEEFRQEMRISQDLHDNDTLETWECPNCREDANDPANVTEDDQDGFCSEADDSDASVITVPDIEDTRCEHISLERPTKDNPSTSEICQKDMGNVPVFPQNHDHY